MKFLLEFIKTLLGRTSKTKGLNNNVKSEIVTMLDEATESGLKDTKKIDDQIEEIKRIEEQIFKAEETAGEIITGERPKRMTAVIYDVRKRENQNIEEKKSSVERIKPKPKRKMSEKQWENLRLGREKKAAKKKIKEEQKAEEKERKEKKKKKK